MEPTPTAASTTLHLSSQRTGFLMRQGQYGVREQECSVVGAPRFPSAAK